MTAPQDIPAGDSSTDGTCTATSSNSGPELDPSGSPVATSAATIAARAGYDSPDGYVNAVPARRTH